MDASKIIEASRSKIGKAKKEIVCFDFSHFLFAFNIILKHHKISSGPGTCQGEIIIGFKNLEPIVLV
ncbi:hypothetical protein [uncultured Desulfobacter sp.]|uniref:hypothetical protein n=1 Tax=uncultured Desulfobacter sp. TaxID=240139 RepID=UPI0029F4FF56|nr:hypothetical protein [uncultured Desulfobacter sp.]